MNNVKQSFLKFIIEQESTNYYKLISLDKIRLKYIKLIDIFIEYIEPAKLHIVGTRSHHSFALDLKSLVSQLSVLINK